MRHDRAESLRTQTLDELETTSLSRRSARVFVACFLGIALAVWLVQAIAVATGRGDAPPFRVPLNVKDIHAFETELEERSVVSRWLLPRVQAVLTGVLRVGNEQAYVGRDGWLFYRQDVDYVVGRPFLSPVTRRVRRSGANAWEKPPEPDPIPALVQFHRQLAERGIALVLVPTPAKSTAHPERFAGAAAAASPQNPSYPAFLDAMKSEGIAVFDPSDILLEERRRTGQPQYLRTDTHWTPEAMERVASRLAAFVRDRVAISPGDATRYARTERTVEGLGDIAVMLKLPDAQRLFEAERVVTHPVSDRTGRAWSPDSSAEALLLGDSFSNIYSLVEMGWGSSAGFAEQLSWALGTPVDRIVVNAGGSHTAREALAREMRRGNDRLRGKRVVVYQFAARELLSGDWRRIELPEFPYRLPVPKPTTRVSAPTASASDGLDAPSKPVPEPAAAERPRSSDKGDAPVRVTGVLAERSDPPKPGSVPYPDCLIGLHLTGAQAESAQAVPPEIVVFTWGMRNNEWTDATTLEIGKKVTLEALSWSQIESRYGGYNRVELQDENTWLLDTFWSDDVDPKQDAP